MGVKSNFQHQENGKDDLVDQETKTVAVRFDFRNGMTPPIQCLRNIYLRRWAWLGSKLGDHVAGMKDEQTKEPASEEDMALAIESLVNDPTLEWNKVRSGEGTVSGAGIVLRALAQHSQ